MIVEFGIKNKFTFCVKEIIGVSTELTILEDGKEIKSTPKIILWLKDQEPYHVIYNSEEEMLQQYDIINKAILSYIKYIEK
jgi:hypothetical protein